MRVLIYGSKEFALTVAELARHCGYEVVGMIDDFNSGPGTLGCFDVVKAKFPPSEYAIAVAIGYSNISGRWQAWKRVRADGYQAPRLVHPRAYVADTAFLGEGCMIMAGAIVDVRAEVGALGVVWPGACINHDTKIGANTFVSPNATICGSVEIGPHTFVGAGASIADHSKVPASSFIKMLSAFRGNTK